MRDPIGLINKQMQILLNQDVGTCSVGDDIWGGEPCNRVLLEIPTDDATLMKLTGLTLQALSSKKESILRHTAFKVIAMISKEHGILCNLVCLNAGGKVISELPVYDKSQFVLELNPQFEDESFQIPTQNINMLGSKEELEAFFRQVRSQNRQ